MVVWMALLAVGLAAADEREAVRQALLPRHDSPPCDALVSTLETPSAALRWVAENVEKPGWVSIRAARCLAEQRPAEGKEALLAWVQDPRWRGLALTTVQSLDQMPPAVAEDVARAAVQGPLSELLRDRVARSESADLRRIASEPDPPPGASEEIGPASLRDDG